MTPGHAEKQVDVLLAEYQACNSTRDHYDGTIWLIGSIFVATSLTIFATSFLDPVEQNPWNVTFLGVVSLGVFFMWVGYELSVRPFVKAAIKRAWEIEDELRKLDYPVLMHARIRETNQTLPRKILRGKYLFTTLILMVLVVWVLRLLLAWHYF
jgi:hypothetical protein